MMKFEALLLAGLVVLLARDQSVCMVHAGDLRTSFGTILRPLHDICSGSVEYTIAEYQVTTTGRAHSAAHSYTQPHSFSTNIDQSQFIVYYLPAFETRVG